MSEDPRFEILEVWRRPLGEDGEAAVRVLARVESGAYGPEEYAVGVSVDPDSVFDPASEETDVFSGLTFAEAHWDALHSRIQGEIGDNSFKVPGRRVSVHPADLGGDDRFSGWAKAPLVTRYDLVGPGRVSFHPTPRSAGPWRVADEGRNQAAGPAIGSKGRRGSRKRWNGRTQGKNTATDALAAIEPKVPRLAEQQVARAIRKAF